MKFKLSYLLPLIIFVACNRDSKQLATEAEQESLAPTPIEKSQPEQIAETPWVVNIDSLTQKIKIQPSSIVNKEDLNTANVIKSLNKKYPEILMVFLKQQSDTVFVKIPDANYLSRESGSMGAQIFMAEATYSFTQIPGVNFLNFDFEEGDHASPGTYQRKDFVF